jgi:hypothetical protein
MLNGGVYFEIFRVGIIQNNELEVSETNGNLLNRSSC